jgi:hypothetical protein
MRSSWVCRTGTTPSQTVYNRRFYVKQQSSVLQKIARRSLRRERNQLHSSRRKKGDDDDYHGEPLLHVVEIMELVRDVWKSRCAIAGCNHSNLVLCRWNNQLPLSARNHICLCAPLARKHSYIRDSDKYYSQSLRDRVDLLLLTSVKS